MRKKTLFFVFYLRYRGTNRWEFYSVSVTESKKKNEDFTFYRESEAWWFIFIYKRPRRCLGETFFSKKKIPFWVFLFCFVSFCFNVWISIWDGSLAGLNMTPEWACVCLLHVAGEGRLLLKGLPWWSLVFSHQSCIFIHRLPIPSLTVHTKHLNETASSKAYLVFNTFYRPTKQGKHAKKKSNVLNRFPNRKNKNKLKHFRFFLHGL